MFLSAYYSAVIDSGNKSGYGSVDDICIDACAPEYAVLGLDTNICHSLRLGAGLKSVLLICDKGIFQTKLLLNSIGNCVQTAVAPASQVTGFPSLLMVTLAVMPFFCTK